MHVATPSAEVVVAVASAPGRTFCLCVERDGGGVGRQSEIIDVPQLTTLSLYDNLVAAAPGLRKGLFALEPSTAGATPVLIATATAQGLRLLVNGAAVGPTHVLQSGDVVTCDASEVRLHVALRYRPYIGPPQPEHVGKSCGVCLLPLEAPRDDERATIVLTCTACEAVLHELGWLGEGEAAEKLECSRTVSNCPVCNAPLVRKETLTYAADAE